MQTSAIETPRPNLRARILTALEAFAESRPGLEYGNYGDVKAYQAESRAITRDLHDARILLRTVELSSIAVELVGAFDAFAGRLSCRIEGGDVHLDYCTGQYYPTEYRRAVCAVLAQALWDHYREDFAASAKPGESAGDAIRRNFKRMFRNPRLARRWFD